MPTSFEQFLANHTPNIPMVGFIVNLVLTALLAAILARYYVVYGNSLSNRKLFASNFMLITLTTMLIITVVKSSLALSLGLVGALSIVRFRAAIKEPEELAYLFLCIAVGLGMGANQRWVTLAGFFLILGLLRIKSHFEHREATPNLYLNITMPNQISVDISDIVATLERHCSAVHLKRLDENSQGMEASFLVQYENFQELRQSRDELRAQAEAMELSFIDNKVVTA